MSKHVPLKVMEEILWHQENSQRLAADETSDYSESRKPVETTTISFRVPKEEAARIGRIAAERGWTVSVLVRNWIQQGRSDESPTDVRKALHDFEESYANLRRAIESAQ